MVRPAATMKPRLMGAMAVRSLGLALMTYTPMIDARTPKAMTIRGNVSPRALFMPMLAKPSSPGSGWRP